MGKYLISGIKIEFNYCFDNYFKNRIEQYQISDNEEVDYKIDVKLVDEIKIPDLELKAKQGNRYYYKIDETNYLQCFINKDKTVGAAVEYRNGLKESTLKISKSVEMNPAEFEYIITGVLFISIALHNEKIAIHASAISYNNDAILFSAPSTTGKSTHANLWKKVFKEKVEYINDDKPILSFEEDGIYVQGSPWSGKSIYNQNIKVKLKSIIFLKQNKENFIKEISAKEKLTHLLRNTHRPIEDHLQNNVFMNFNKLIKEIPMYELHCNISEEAVLSVYNKLYKENKI